MLSSLEEDWDKKKQIKRSYTKSKRNLFDNHFVLALTFYIVAREKMREG